jgi:short-subunit dehydrogenase involved in D-alanine esterification of teichoic acids
MTAKNSIKQVVLITAGASGIGAELAKAFRLRGDTVHICDIDQLSLNQAVAEQRADSATLCDV